MKVKLLNKYILNGKKINGWLLIDKEYLVLSVEIDINGTINFRIVSENSSMPTLFPIKFFEITCGKLSKNWIAQYDRHEGFELQPKRWGKSDFWIDYFNGDKDAVRIYEEEKGILFNEFDYD